MSLAIGREREKITYKVGINLCYKTFYRKSEDITSNKLYVVPLASVTFSLPLKQKISFFYQYLTWMAGIDQLTKLPNVSSTTTVRMPSHIKNPTSIMPKLTSTYSFIRPITQTSVFVTVAYSRTGHGMRLAINQNGTANSTKVSHLPFYRLFQMIVSCNLQINNSLTFCKRKLMLYINSLLQHLMVTKQVGLLQALQQSVYLPSNSPWYQPH